MILAARRSESIFCTFSLRMRNINPLSCFLFHKKSGHRENKLATHVVCTPVTPRRSLEGAAEAVKVYDAFILRKYSLDIVKFFLSELNLTTTAQHFDIIEEFLHKCPRICLGRGETDAASGGPSPRHLGEGH